MTAQKTAMLRIAISLLWPIIALVKLVAKLIQRQQRYQAAMTVLLSLDDQLLREIGLRRSDFSGVAVRYADGEISQLSLSKKSKNKK